MFPEIESTCLPKSKFGSKVRRDTETPAHAPLPAKFRALPSATGLEWGAADISQIRTDDPQTRESRYKAAQPHYLRRTMMSKVSPLVGLIIALNLGSLGLVTTFVVVTSSRSGEPSRSARQFPQTAEDVVRLLIADPDHFRRDAAAIRSLQALGKSSIPPLLMALKHSSANVRAAPCTTPKASSSHSWPGLWV